MRITHLTLRNWRTSKNLDIPVGTSGARQDERDLSDGTLRLIGLLWSLVEVGRKGGPAPRCCWRNRSCHCIPPSSECSRPCLQPPRDPTVRRSSSRPTAPSCSATRGIRADEVLLLIPTVDGTSGLVLGADEQAVQLLASGLTVAEVALPRTEPTNIESLADVTLGRR